METENYPRPKVGTKTGQVWDIADAITRETGRVATRKEVSRRALEMGGNANTAQTQYTHWRANFETEAAPEGIDSSTPQTVQIQVREAGRIVMPIEFRNALNIAEGDTLTARIEDGEIRLMPLSIAIRKAQELVRQYIPANATLVDDLIAERMREDRE